MSYPQELYYTEDHEWIKIENGTATVGVTEFAQGELGDVVFVEVETEGEELETGSVFGSIEAVKTVAELYMPIDGKVVEKNAALDDKPELVNESPYEEGWIVKLELKGEADTSKLLSAEDYEKTLS